MILQDLTILFQDAQNYGQKGHFVILFSDVTKNLFYGKRCVFSQESTCLYVSSGGNRRKLVKKGILELYLVKFTLKLKFLQVWSLAIQVPR